MNFKLSICAVAVLVYAMATPAKACCGVYPTLTSAPMETTCVGQPMTMVGTVTGTETWDDAYSTGPVTMSVQIQAPGGALLGPPVTLSNLQGFPNALPAYATWDFTCPFTPMEAGTYLYTETVMWTSALGWTESNTSSGSFDVVQCPGKITGGGWFLRPGGVATNKEDKNTFGFVAQYVDGSDLPFGNMELQIHGNSMNIKGTAVAGLSVFDNTGICSGTCSVNGDEGGHPFVMTVVDNGEPGKNHDTISVSVAGVIVIPPTVIDSGNIQVHK